MLHQVALTRDASSALTSLLTEAHYDRIFCLCDETTRQLCRPLLDACLPLRAAGAITIAAGDEHKTLAALQSVWSALQAGGATRHSLLVNLGGGMVTDLGGFAAATFKRGIAFVNVPTTLLSMVDAAVGGKTGINFGGLKNEVGAFCDSLAVVIDPAFLATLGDDNLLSGYAEMLKHALLQGREMTVAHLRYDVLAPNADELLALIKQSLEVKARIVQADPHEQGLRKALNLGHTVGHAIESLLLERSTPVLHGYAVAWGLISELYVSVATQGFAESDLRAVAQYVRQRYGVPAITCRDYERLYALMRHDKKNAGDRINLTLLGAPGDIRLDCTASRELLNESLDFLREG